MDLRLPLLLVCLVACNGVSWVEAAECNLKEYMRCSDLIHVIKMDGACDQLNKAVQCMADVMAACGMPMNHSMPVCGGDKPYSCGMLLGVEHAPMSGSSMGLHYDCKTFKELNNCHEENCGPDGKQFKSQFDQGPPRNPKSDKVSCSRNATINCVFPVKDVTEVTQDTCVKVGAAKNCFLDQLDYCGGSDQEQLTVDVIAAGLGRHIWQCKEKGYGFTNNGSICAPNPIDSLIPIEAYEVMKSPPPDGPTEEACNPINKVAQNVMEYRKSCHVTAWNEAALSTVLTPYMYIQAMCHKSGYKGTGSGAATWVKGHHTGGLLLTLVLCALQAMRIFY